MGHRKQSIIKRIWFHIFFVICNKEMGFDIFSSDKKLQNTVTRKHVSTYFILQFTVVKTGQTDLIIDKVIWSAENY